MRIEHIAIWTQQLETLRAFYETYFSGQSERKYTNPTNHFESYFLTFTSGARLELMQTPDITPSQSNSRIAGFAHLAFAVGSREKVDKLTERLETDGYQVVSRPRITGDGYYECAVLDPEGNWIEITI